MYFGKGTFVFEEMHFHSDLECKVGIGWEKAELNMVDGGSTAWGCLSDLKYAVMRSVMEVQESGAHSAYHQ